MSSPPKPLSPPVFPVTITTSSINTSSPKLQSIEETTRAAANSLLSSSLQPPPRLSRVVTLSASSSVNHPLAKPKLKPLQNSFRSLSLNNSASSNQGSPVLQVRHLGLPGQPTTTDKMVALLRLIDINPYKLPEGTIVLGFIQNILGLKAT